MLRRRLSRLERQRAPCWPGYAVPVFSDEHLAEVAGILAESLGAEAVLAHHAARTAEPVPAELQQRISERGGRQHVSTE